MLFLLLDLFLCWNGLFEGLILREGGGLWEKAVLIVFLLICGECMLVGLRLNCYWRGFR